MNRLIGDLVDVVSLDAGKPVVTPEVGDTTSVVTEVVEAFEEHAAQNEVSLSAEIGPPLVAEFDPARILQVLTNLLSNAIKFTPAKGKVVVRLARVGDDIRFAVSDTGVGLPSDQLEAVFGRFVQVAGKDRRGWDSASTSPRASCKHTGDGSGQRAGSGRAALSTSRSRSIPHLESLARCRALCDLLSSAAERMSSRVRSSSCRRRPSLWPCLCHSALHDLAETGRKARDCATRDAGPRSLKPLILSTSSGVSPLSFATRRSRVRASCRPPTNC